MTDHHEDEGDELRAARDQLRAFAQTDEALAIRQAHAESERIRAATGADEASRSPARPAAPATTEPPCACATVATTHHVGLPRALALKLREMRRDCGASNAELAQRVGCRARTLSAVFDGTRRPSAAVAVALGDALKLPTDTRIQLMQHVAGGHNDGAPE